MRFWKYEGLGNDFVVVEEPVESDAAAALCDRRLGIGADGVLALGAPSCGGDASVAVLNSDGSEAEVCGNGLRCIALHLAQSRGGTTVTLEAGSGLRRCSVVSMEGPRGATVEVEMGRPVMDRPAIPVRGTGRLVQEPIEVLGRTLHLTAVGLGNPHAVTFDPVAPDEVPVLGPAIERHGLFPARVNVGFASLAGAHELRLIVWERGAGLTGACGSGACAAVAAGCEIGLLQPGEPVRVIQPGGALTVAVQKDGSVLMTGPARLVFRGEVDLRALLAARATAPAPR